MVTNELSLLHPLSYLRIQTQACHDVKFYRFDDIHRSSSATKGSRSLNLGSR